jgi:hypothetical protein
MECLICHQYFELEGNLCPYVLFCGHSFCQNDIRLLIEQRMSQSTETERERERDRNRNREGISLSSLSKIHSS